MPRWQPFEPYFWSLVKKTKGCWLWTGNIDSKGYGRVHFRGARHRAHRVAYILTHGDRITSALLCHHCDNKVCVKPAHMFVGTNADNMRDCRLKGRTARGEKNGSNKLTIEQVRAIRLDHRPQKIVAKEYGVAQPAISRIHTRARWGHLS